MTRTKIMKTTTVTATTTIDINNVDDSAATTFYATINWN